MPVFARTIGIDYSGAETPTASLKGLRAYMERWPGESGHRDKRIFCLRAARIAAYQEGDHDETFAPQSQCGLQGEGGFGCHQGRSDA
ncbi:MAG: hypothetical protein FJ271_31975, partial [Planctomycetes bacterium]|nr:hypothetical protein [Planctomycetota bacterium]